MFEIIRPRPGHTASAPAAGTPGHDGLAAMRNNVAGVARAGRDAARQILSHDATTTLRQTVQSGGQ